MLQYLKQESNKTFTENGAVTLKTTDSDCLDLFATIGAIRRESDEEIIARFMRAFAENKDVAIIMLKNMQFDGKERLIADFQSLYESEEVIQ